MTEDRSHFMDKVWVHMLATALKACLAEGKGRDILRQGEALSLEE